MSDIKELEQILKFNKKPLLAILDVLNELNENIVKNGNIEIPEQKDTVNVSNINEITDSISELSKQIQEHLEKRESYKEELSKLLEKEQDYTNIINALKKVENKIPFVEDYTNLIQELLDNVKNNKVDLSKVEKELKTISENLIKDVEKTEIIPEYLLHTDGLKVKLYEGDLKRLEKAFKVTVASGGSGGFPQDLTSSNNNTSEKEVNVSLKGHICNENSTMTLLKADETFTGVWQDTIDYGNISIGIKTDVDSATDGLIIQWSADGSTVQDIDKFTITGNVGKTFTFGPARRYVRVVYTNGSTDQTVFDLETALRRVYVKPSSHRIQDSIVAEDDAELNKSVLTGEDPNGVFKNVGVQISGALRNSIEDGQTGRRAEVEPLGALKTQTPVRLVGTTFSNGTKDPNFWTETVTGSGSVTQSGEIILATGTTADSTAKYQTVRKARKITGTTNQFRAVARNVETPAADCIRRIGAYDDNNGFFFQFNGATFQVGSRKNGVDTLVSNGSFNGNGGATIDFGGGTEFTRVIIDYTALSAKFFIDGTLIHTIMPTTASLTNTLNLPATAEIINENGNTTDNSYEILFATILRLGELTTNATSEYIGTNTTTVLKYNAGTLQRIVNLDNAGTVTIYDNTVASGTVIATIDTTKALGTLEFNAPFSNGLTVVTSLGAKISVIYE